MASRFPDPYLVATTKLSQEWSANRAVTHINDQWLDTLLADERFDKVDAMVRCRLILAGLIALHQPAYQDNSIARSELQDSLRRLQQAVVTAGDKDRIDEWVKVTAASAGPLDGRLHLDTVVQQSAAVQETVSSLKEQVQQSSNQHLFPPLEDVYLNSSSAGFHLNTNSSHFKLKQHPRVQPLASGVSYAAATPPPQLGTQTPLQGVDQGAANPAWIRQKQQKADIMRTASIPQQSAPSVPHPTPPPAAAAAASAAGDGTAVRRFKSSAVKAPRLQMLDDSEQQEMNELLKQQSARKKDKGHGLALRRTENVEPLVATVSTRIRLEDYNTPAAAGTAGFGAGRFKPAGIRLKKAAGSGAAAAAGAGDGSPRAARDDYYENVRDDDDDFIVRGDVDYRMKQGEAAEDDEAMYGVTGAVERDIDELFEDSVSEEEGDRRAVTGVSRSGRLHHHGVDRDEQTPEELQDEMDDIIDEDADVAVAAAAGEAAGSVADVREGQQQGQPAAAAAGLAAKRRRVVVDDEDDD